MIDVVLSGHMNPLTCGTAKFNHQLAKRLGVPCCHFGEDQKRRFLHPLLSLRDGEIEWDDVEDIKKPYSVFVHDEKIARGLPSLIRGAAAVFGANDDVTAELRKHRPDVLTVFAPSTVEGNATRGAYRVLTFGMAHKLLAPHYERLKEQLDREHPDYTIELSTAVHEGSPWSAAIEASVAMMRGIFGDKLRVLGFLADDALARLLQEVDAVAIFFDPAFRANNTSAWAALEAGKHLYTNTDEHSPAFDVQAHSWDRLVDLIRG